MFKLVTGLPGAGKTSNELWKFLNAPEYANRPKFCTPVNGFEPEKHGVTPIDHISCWQDLPEGAVIFCDEVQDYIGTDLGKIEPDWVKQLARHRHSGYDFICTTQSPMYLHSFVRKLAQPHIHYAKPYGMKGFEYQWETVQNDPTTKSAKAIGQRKMVSPNPGVFKVYTSTVLDTHKARPPYKILITLGLFALFAISLSIFSFTRVKHIGEPDHPVKTDTITTTHVVAPIAPSPSSSISSQPATDTQAKTTWTEESVKPRIPGLAYTAPIYDQLTAPTDFPRVAGCMTSKDPDRCRCYTQQGTPLDVPASACEVFVKVGNFDPWLSGRRQQQQQLAQSKQAPQAAQTGKASQPSSVPNNVSVPSQRAQSQGAEARGFETVSADYPQRVATVNGSKLAQVQP